MLDFLEANLAAILAAIVAFSGMVVSIMSFIKAIKAEKSGNANVVAVDKKIEITQEGIVKAFKSAIMIPELKVSLSNQVDAKLNEWAAQFMAAINKRDKAVTETLTFIMKILAWTAASDKLTKSEKAQINALVEQITEGDSTIEWPAKK